MLMRTAGLVLILVACATIAYWAKPRLVEATDPKLQFQLGLATYDHHKFSGVLVERYDTGPLYRETRYEEGLPNGYMRQFALNGNVVKVGNFVQGQKDGLEQQWFSEGPRSAEFHFSKGLREGQQTQWHLNGEIFREEFYTKGVLVDKKILFADGKIFTNYKTDDARIYGIDGGALCMERKPEGAR